MGNDPSVWLRSTRWHTYKSKPQPEGSVYLAHEDMVETIVDVLKFAVRDTPPPIAKRPSVAAPVVPPSITSTLTVPPTVPMVAATHEAQVEAANPQASPPTTSQPVAPLTTDTAAPIVRRRRG